MLTETGDKSATTTRDRERERVYLAVQNHMQKIYLNIQYTTEHHTWVTTRFNSHHQKLTTTCKHTPYSVMQLFEPCFDPGLISRIKKTDLQYNTLVNSYTVKNRSLVLLRS